MSKEAIEHYEAALKEAFPSGATGNVFHHWNEARKALAEQPAPMIRGDIRDGLVDDEPAHQHIEHCLWARNGNQPCPHVQPAQQQEHGVAVFELQESGWEIICDGDWIQTLPLRTKLYTSPPAQRKYCRGDRLICLETEEYCVIHISGTDRQWVKFPDTHIGVYKNEQLAELFELLPKEIEIEQPASKPWVGLTDEEIEEMANDFEEGYVFLYRSFARAIEAKLRERNT